jgi:pimeloyl-ACP methyl ester carboxylesterase
MSTFVLVHGAWGGCWGFRKVRPLLWAAGHQVFTPSLTGIGEREHLSSPDVSLSTHVRDVVATVTYEDLDDIVLLGFSYGGMVVTGALDEIGDRVDHLVYLDAFVPGDGESIADLVGGVPPTDPERNWLVPPRPRELATPAETEWANERRSLQPIGTFTEAVSLRAPLEDRPFSLTYIKATADPGEADDSTFHQAAARAAASPRWHHHEIATNHMVPLMEPEALVDILLGLTDGRGAAQPS